MGKKTPFYQAHEFAHAKIVDFAGWDMPLHYGSQLNEHHLVRQQSGMFDVSHMTIIDIEGVDAGPYLRYLLANDVDKLKQPGKALYSCMLNEKAGIVDDLIVYFLAPFRYRLIVNSSTREKDIAWITQQAASFNVAITERSEFAILAVQGPLARTQVNTVLPLAQQQALSALKPFHALIDGEWLFARTGYTGEEGLEIILPAEKALDFWQQLLDAGVAPCGLGARDTLRLEAGLSLYGADMDETTTPWVSNLAWTVAWDPNRDFIGKSALLAQQTQGITQRLVGLVLEGKGVLRSHQRVLCQDGSAGEITSGSFSPTLGFSIALARIPMNTDTQCSVIIRDKAFSAHIVSPPFVRQGKKVFISTVKDKELI